MSPLDTELREALRHHAADVTSPGAPLDAIERRAHGIRRRRTALAVGGTAVVVAAVAVAVPLITDAASHDDSRAKFAVTQTPAPGPTATTGATAAPNALNWPLRESGSVAMSYPAGQHTLWAGKTPSGDVVVVYQRVPIGQTSAHTFVGVTPHDGSAGYSLDYGVTQTGAAQVSAVLPGGAYPYVVVVGAPTTGQILYAADGATFKPVDTVDGVAVFERTGPTGSSPDLIEVLDGDGNLDAPMYKGVIDTGSSVPDK